MLTCASEGSTKQHHQLIWSWRAAGTVQTGGEKLVQKIFGKPLHTYDGPGSSTYRGAPYIDHNAPTPRWQWARNWTNAHGEQYWTGIKPTLNHIWSNGFHCFAFVSNFAAFITCIIFVVGHCCGAQILGLFHDHSHVGNPNICDCALVPFIIFHCLFLQFWWEEIRVQLPLKIVL